MGYFLKFGVGMALMGALPARFRRERVLVVGCGDVGGRMLPRLRGAKVYALTSSPQRVGELRAAGGTPLLGNLDEPVTLGRLAGLATRVVHLAPPPNAHLVDWRLDPRTRALVRVLSRRGRPLSWVYGSTSGVYGDCQGAWVDETRALQPTTPRAQRRVDAESQVRWWGRAFGGSVAVLRIPGIYAADRPGGTPRERLERGTPVLRAEDDVYTNHINADDLAQACTKAMWRAKGQRVYNVSDDTVLKMGDYFDLAADLYGLPRPPRIAREGAEATLPLMLLSFMSESRRLRNDRMKRELGVVLRYPTVEAGLRPSTA
jgi:nucleoside-diphosphate-sugar epimerase